MKRALRTLGHFIYYTVLLWFMLLPIFEGHLWWLILTMPYALSALYVFIRWDSTRDLT